MWGCWDLHPVVQAGMLFVPIFLYVLVVLITMVSEPLSTIASLSSVTVMRMAASFRSQSVSSQPCGSGVMSALDAAAAAAVAAIDDAGESGPGSRCMDGVAVAGSNRAVRQRCWCI